MCQIFDHFPGPQNPPKVKYFFSNAVIVDWSIFHMYSPSRTTTPSQSEILNMSRYNIVFACIDWFESPLAT